MELSDPYIVSSKASTGLDGGQIAGIVIGSVLGGLVGIAVLVGAVAVGAYRLKQFNASRVGQKEARYVLVRG